LSAADTRGTDFFADVILLTDFFHCAWKSSKQNGNPW